jgi:hypothetical protein
LGVGSQIDVGLLKNEFEFLKISVGQNYVNAKILGEAHFCLLHTSAVVAKLFH